VSHVTVVVQNDVPTTDLSKWETQKRDAGEGGQTSDQDKALEAAAETLPAGFGRQDTHHQVLYRFVIFLHVV
jgi:hypothetical protein